MNKSCHRLVFNARRGMLCAVAETVRSSGKSGSGQTRGGQTPNGQTRNGQTRSAVQWAGLGLLGTGLVLGPFSTWAAAPIPRALALPGGAALPVRSTDAARTAGDWGQFNVTQPQANRMVVNQQSLRAIVNWDQFNIAAGNTVQFVQPDKGATLNKIWDANPSVVQGRIQANGEVLLQNQNGIVFGPTARVETGRFVATALQVAEDAFKRGLRGIVDGSPAFDAAADRNQGFVSLERGAEVRTAAGGDVLIFAPRVVNEGRIETPDGQTILGAGRTVYLAASVDPAQRGLLVGVRPFASDADLDTVLQAEARRYKTVAGETVPDSTPSTTVGLVERLNAVVATRGSINLVGLAVRQNGVLQATTAVKGRNGSIQLQAQADVNPLVETAIGGSVVYRPEATALGSVVLGPRSRTEVLPSNDAAQTQLDSETFYTSRIRVEGERIQVQRGAQVRAPAGRIEMLASQQPAQSLSFNPDSNNLVDHSSDPSRVVIEAGAVLDVAGLKGVALPMSRNQMSGRLFQIELADAPVQRDGVLYREEVFFDARKPPKVADVSGFFNTVARTAEERSTHAGTISLLSDGAVAVDAGARLDISGGSLAFAAGQLKTSLLRQGERWIAIDRADPATRYDELGNAKARTDAGTAQWRVDEVAGYVDGKNAGRLDVAGRRVYFAGQVDGHTVQGLGQDGRGSTPLPNAGTLTLGRSRLTDVSLPALKLQAGPALSRPVPLFDAPLTAAIDTHVASTLLLSTQALAESGIGTLNAYVSGRFDVAEGSTLNFPARGQLQVEAAQVDVAGSVRAAGGRIALSTLRSDDLNPDITLGVNTRLDVAGTWAVDPAGAAAGDAPATTVLQGGQIQLTAVGSLVAPASAQLDVSAGALRSGTRVTQGKAGSISLGLNQGADVLQNLPGRFDGWQAQLNAFDFDKGGSLVMSGLPSLTLGGNLALPYFGNALFRERGLGNITLNSLGDVRLASGLDLQPRLLNFVALAATDADERFASVQLKPLAAQRSPVSVTLNATTAPNRVAQLRGSDLVVQAGARLALEAGAALRLSARGQLTVAGTLEAPGGQISLMLAGTRGGAESAGVFEDQQGFDATQALWLTSSARLNAAGTSELSLDRLGRPVGQVLGGGTVSLLAERGYVVAQAGAQIDLRGRADKVLLADAPTAQRVAKDGGTLVLRTAEGFHLAAEVLATAPAGADGGRLDAAISLNGRDRKTSGPAYGTSDREVVLVEKNASLDALNAAPGDNLLAALPNGRGVLSQEQLSSGGFAHISLKADDRVTLAENLMLSAQRSLSLDAPVLAGRPGIEATLSAPVVSLGDQRRSPRASFESAPVAQGGSAVLEVNAGLVELQGDLALDGFKFSAFNATRDDNGQAARRDGEVRLMGVARGPSSSAPGSLSFAGELQFTSGQTYATTMSEFSIRGLAGDSLLGSYLPAGGSSSASPLSALALLSLQADALELGGVMRQPFGRIEVQGRSVQVLAGAELTASGVGQTVPVGTTVNSRQWQYRSAGLSNAAGVALPVNAQSDGAIRTLAGLPVDKGVVIQAEALTLDPQARLSVAGGGQLQAWEFVPGVGGSTDALLRLGQYAVLPGYRYAYAPHDAEVMNGGAAGSMPAAGAQLQITQAGSALAPGRYTLLPARYALLTGAVLVSLAADQGKGALVAALEQDDGSRTVNGIIGNVGSATGSGSTSPAAALQGTPARIRVEPAATVAARSRLDLSSVGSLLAAAADRKDQPVPRLPVDAGQLTLASSQAFNLQAQLHAGAAEGGKPGSVDVAFRGGAAAVVNKLQPPPAGLAAGTALWSAQTLAQAGAGSLLLGGVRTADGSVSTRNDSVEMLATETALVADEVMLLARNSVHLASGTQVRSSGAPRSAVTNELTTADVTASISTWVLDGDSAYALATQAGTAQVSRRYTAAQMPGATGQLQVDAGAKLEAATLRLGGSAGLNLSDQTELLAQDLGLSARRLALGTPTAASADTTVLSGGLLASLSSAKSLTLSSLSSIDFYGSQRFVIDSLTLDTPALRGAGSDQDRVQFQAREVNLRNTSAAAPDTSQTGRGSLDISALPVLTDVITGGLTLGSEQAGQGQQFLGFTSMALRSAGDAVFAGLGGFTAQGDATLSAARVGARSAAEQSLQAPQGSLRINQETGSRSRGEALGQGALLNLAGVALEQQGHIELPGGQLTLQASGPAGIVMGSGSSSSVAGLSRQAGDGWQVHGDAGRLVARASQGAIVLAGRLDVSATGDAQAGALVLQATGANGGVDIRPTLNLQGHGGTAARQGRISLYATRLLQDGQPAANIDALAQALGRGGFTDTVQLRLRSGDLNLEQATLQAQRVELAADAGTLRIGGTLNARAAAGGQVRAFAGQGVELSGRIDARSSRSGANGGDVQLGSSNGAVVLTSSARIDASGDDAADGRIVLRARRDDSQGAVAIQIDPALDSRSALQAGEVVLEAVRTYTGFTSLARGNSSGAALGQTALRTDALAFANRTADTLADLGLAQDGRVSLRPSVQIVADGDFTVRDDWNLWDANRPGGQPGFLSIRAAGSLVINGSLSDGFASAVRPPGAALTAPTGIQEGAAWSYRLVAGADTAAADPLATRAIATGNLSVANDKLVRTTGGSIEMAAAQDINLVPSGSATQQAVVYVAGRPSAQNTQLELGSSAWSAQFTAQGGGVSLQAGRDVVGAPTTQQFGAWFYHTGSEDSTAVAWWSAFDAFRQGVGSFGGGNLRVQAGRDVLNLGVVAPSSALAPAAPSALFGDATQQPVPVVENGGDIAVQAGRNILGGSYFLGRGQGLLEAGAHIGAGQVFAPGRLPATGAMLGLMDGGWQLSARTGVELGGVFNPTMMPSANRAFSGRLRIGDTDGGAFFTYSPSANLRASSQTGTVAWRAERPAGEVGMASYWSALAANGPTAERIDWTSKYLGPTSYAPPVVQLQALGGDLGVFLPASSRGLTLFPSAQGELSLYAQTNLQLQTNSNTAALVMSDQPPEQLPSPAQPVLSLTGPLDNFNNATFEAPTTAVLAKFSSLHDGASDPVRLHAEGTVSFNQGGRNSRVLLVSPKPVQITAGADILDLGLIAQHSDAAQTSLAQAQGNITQGPGASGSRITLAGPGALELSAGRQLDLGSSQGVETVGNLYRNSLPAEGASIVLAAGQRGVLDVAAFTQRYLSLPGAADSALAEGAAQAAAYLQATGRNAENLDSEGRVLLAQLTQRFSELAALTGKGSAARVQQRRDELVVAVRLALGQEALAPEVLAASYDASLQAFKGLSPVTQTRIAEGMLNALFAQSYLASGQPYAPLWQAAALQAGADPAVFAGEHYQRLQRQVLFQELTLAGSWASPLPGSAAALRGQAYALGFTAADLVGQGNSLRFKGDLDMVASGVQTLQGGSIQMLAPGGQINVGLPGTSVSSPQRLKGAVVYGQGDLSALSEGDFQVNSQRVFIVGQGDVTIWSSSGNIDAGRGANTSVSVPPLVATRQEDGSIRFTLPSLTVGSGIGILQPAVGEAAGDIGLFAPRGEVRALDAQIRAPGRITLAADVVRGADNIAGGSVVGAPVVVPSVPLSLPSAAPAAGDAAASAAAAANQNAAAQARERQALLMVELLGLGLADEATDPCLGSSAKDRAECEKRSPPAARTPAR